MALVNLLIAGGLNGHAQSLYDHLFFDVHMHTRKDVGGRKWKLNKEVKGGASRKWVFIASLLIFVPELSN